MQIIGKDNIRCHALLTSILTGSADSTRLEIKAASKGCLIVLEGIDGTGKTTLAQALGKKLSEDLGEMVIVTQEPTERFKEFQELENLLALHPGHPSGYVDSAALTSLKFTLDHAIHLADVIVPALADDRVVICDRWTPFSSLAYQGPVASVLTQKWDICPDATMLLTMDPEMAMQRLGDRAQGQLPGFEKLETLKKAHEAYQEMSRTWPMSWWSFDATLPQVVLLDRAVRIASSYVNKRRG